MKSRRAKFRWIMTVLLLPGAMLQLPSTGRAAELYTFRVKGGVYYTNVPAPGRTPCRMPVTRRKQTPAGRALFSTNPAYAREILSACARFDVDPHLVQAMIQAESAFNPGAVSPKGAAGLMQLMPETARDLGVIDPLDPFENIRGGVGYLRRLLDDLDGNLSLALAAYNAGPGRVANYQGIPPFRETRAYIERVLNYYQRFKSEDTL